MANISHSEKKNTKNVNVETRDKRLDFSIFWLSFFFILYLWMTKKKLVIYYYTLCVCVCMNHFNCKHFMYKTNTYSIKRVTNFRTVCHYKTEKKKKIKKDWVGWKLNTKGALIYTHQKWFSFQHVTYMFEGEENNNWIIFFYIYISQLEPDLECNFFTEWKKHDVNNSLIYYAYKIYF